MSVGSTIFFLFPQGPGSGLILVKFKHTNRDLTTYHIPSLLPVHTVRPDSTRHNLCPLSRALPARSVPAAPAPSVHPPLPAKGRCTLPCCNQLTTFHLYTHFAIIFIF